jgi:hypothetical protein
MWVKTTACILLGLLACTETSRRLDDTADYAPREIVELDTWLVQHGGVDLGFLVKLEIRDPAGPIEFYRVLNVGRQWLGHATMDLRFSRRVPFQEEEEGLGMYPMRRGLAVLYQVEDPVDLTLLERASASEASILRRDRE